MLFARGVKSGFRACGIGNVARNGQALDFARHSVRFFRITSTTATFAPAAASTRAVSAPSPDAPPVTIAACPLRFTFSTSFPPIADERYFAQDLLSSDALTAADLSHRSRAPSQDAEREQAQNEFVLLIESFDSRAQHPAIGFGTGRRSFQNRHADTDGITGRTGFGHRISSTPGEAMLATLERK